MSWSPQISGTMYIDNLDDEREINRHPVVRIKTNQGDILVTAPPELLAHKISETMFYASRVLSPDAREKTKQSYDKDIRDIATLFYGFYELYGEEFLERVFRTLIEKDHSQFGISENEDPRVQEYYELELFKKIREDCMAVLLEIGSPEAAMDIETFFYKLLDKRRAIVRESGQNNK